MTSNAGTPVPAGDATRATDDAFDPGEYWEKRLRANPTIKGVGYASYAESFNVWMYKVRRAVFDQTVRKYRLAAPAAKVLDAGSGTGFYIDRWLRQGAVDVQGLDLTNAAVEILRARFPQVPFHVADLGDTATLATLPIAPGSIDVISCMDVLFHIVDDARLSIALSTISTLLKPGGHFVLSDNFVHGEAIRATHHVSRSLEDYTQRLDAAGFEILDRRPMFIHMNAPVDTPDPARTARWTRRMDRFARTELRGKITGPAMYPLERLLVSRRPESASTEIMVCRKRG